MVSRARIVRRFMGSGIPRQETSRIAATPRSRRPSSARLPLPELARVHGALPVDNGGVNAIGYAPDTARRVDYEGGGDPRRCVGDGEFPDETKGSGHRSA